MKVVRIQGLLRKNANIFPNILGKKPLVFFRKIEVREKMVSLVPVLRKNQKTFPKIRRKNRRFFLGFYGKAGGFS